MFTGNAVQREVMCMMDQGMCMNMCMSMFCCTSMYRRLPEISVDHIQGLTDIEIVNKAFLKCGRLHEQEESRGLPVIFLRNTVIENRNYMINSTASMQEVRLPSAGSIFTTE